MGIDLRVLRKGVRGCGSRARPSTARHEEPSFAARARTGTRLAPVPRAARCHARPRQIIPPIYQCNEGHMVCTNPRPNCRNCPTCRGPLGNIRNRALERCVSKVGQPSRPAHRTAQSPEHTAMCAGDTEARRRTHPSHRSRRPPAARPRSSRGWLLSVCCVCLSCRPSRRRTGGRRQLQVPAPSLPPSLDAKQRQAIPAPAILAPWLLSI